MPEFKKVELMRGLSEAGVFLLALNFLTGNLGRRTPELDSLNALLLLVALALTCFPRGRPGLDRRSIVALVLLSVSAVTLLALDGIVRLFGVPLGVVALECPQRAMRLFLAEVLGTVRWQAIRITAVPGCQASSAEAVQHDREDDGPADHRSQRVGGHTGAVQRLDGE